LLNARPLYGTKLMPQLTPDEQVLQALDCVGAYGKNRAKWLAHFLLEYRNDYLFYDEETAVQQAIHVANQKLKIT
jgi:hypothetical protein